MKWLLIISFIALIVVGYTSKFDWFRSTIAKTLPKINNSKIKVSITTENDSLVYAIKIEKFNIETDSIKFSQYFQNSLVPIAKYKFRPGQYYYIYLPVTKTQLITNTIKDFSCLVYFTNTNNAMIESLVISYRNGVFYQDHKYITDNTAFK